MTNERQAAEKDLQLRSRFAKILNVPNEGTLPVLTRLRPCRITLLSSLLLPTRISLDNRNSGRTEGYGAYNAYHCVDPSL
jgi:hypothetical protein